MKDPVQDLLPLLCPLLLPTCTSAQSQALERCPEGQRKSVAQLLSQRVSTFPHFSLPLPGVLQGKPGRPPVQRANKQSVTMAL